MFVKTGVVQHNVAVASNTPSQTSGALSEPPPTVQDQIYDPIYDQIYQTETPTPTPTQTPASSQPKPNLFFGAPRPPPADGKCPISQLIVSFRFLCTPSKWSLGVNIK